MIDRQLEVYRDFEADPSSITGFRYGRRQVLGEASSISPLADPATMINIADLLPQPAGNGD